MVTLIIIGVLVLIAALSDAVIDTLNFHYELSKLPQSTWWNPKYSWYRKWKITDQGLIIPNHKNKAKWYYLWVYRPNFVEAFPYSSTLLVFTTDAFHLFKSIRLNALFIALTVAFQFKLEDSIIIFLIFRAIYGVTFELLFRCLK